MVAATLLAGLASSSTALLLSSRTTVNTASLRDATLARIAADLEQLRQYSWRFACEDGSDGGTSTACTGQTSDADKPVKYKTARVAGGSTASSPPPLTALAEACRTQSMAKTMQQQAGSALPGGPTPLPLISALPGVSRLALTRTIQVDPLDANRLNITYSTAAGAPVSVRFHATLIPQAVGWCA